MPKKEETKEKYFEVYDDNWDAVMIFCKMQTQWNTSFAGLVGLRYEILLMQGGMFDLYNITERSKILEDIQIMEATALKEFNKEGKK